MEELAVEPQVVRHAVGSVAGDREADRSEVDPDLVCPPGLERHREQSMLGQQLAKLEMRDGGARRLGVE